MPQPKGKSGNPNGRPKGRPNKVTADLRSLVITFIDKNMNNLQTEYDKLESKDKLLFLEKMMQYTLPKMQAVQMNVTPDLNNLDDKRLTELFIFHLKNSSV